MFINDLLLCTFEGDTKIPPTNFVAEITAINTAAATFDCRLVDSGQQFTFNYNHEPWAGKDATGVDYILASHNIYTGGKTGPFPEGVSRVTFADNKSYLCYVDRVALSIDVIFYHYPSPELSFENNRITKSNWDAYPVGSRISDIEGCVLNNDLPKVGTSITTNKPAPPYLFVDVSHWSGNPDWDILANTPKFYGAIIKATQGTSYSKVDWFKKNWPLLKDAGKERYGKTWFRGAYHFLKFNKDGDKQADYYLSIIDDAGGWDDGDILPVIDVEMGNDGSENPSKRNSNHDASAQQIIDCTTKCAERLRSVTGRDVILYGRGAMRDKRIKSKMGCSAVWNPSYTTSMVRNGLDAWSLDDIVLWQYTEGKNKTVPGGDTKKFPGSIAGWGKTDISVYIEGTKTPSFDSLLKRLGIGS